MRLGIALPQYGALADPARIGEFAAVAEGLGYRSMWAGDRVLTPTRPSDLYPGGTPDRPYPPEFTRFVDPLVTLTAAAGTTTDARLGTSTLTGTLHPPVLLARSLTSIDLLSGGRLEVGLGLSWLRDEYTAAGVPWAERGRRLDELLDVLTAMWTSNPVSHDGPHWRIPESTVDLRPAQSPRPPLLLGGFTRRALERVGRRADGWLGVELPAPLFRERWDLVRAAAESAGRDPDAVRRVVRVNPVADTSVPELARRLDAVRELGAEDVFVDLHYVADGVDAALEYAAALAVRTG
ncbi:LLM class F420-dependent oxidoreductase [Amycolatopsis antarctica]|uniref:LLM class F420-dependent oxidoreductase n=1 Tax=Amycolatopsis antarctica TaxID=1854586 RepID=A0A263D8W7_9PSEU|nr:TIGR03619 family F420-dependent LLM class oxidoreductase [Amycolatopsis antarctica]OZM74831.1 LLM class F420-dependent oxidoreductase [Amycolatopsis antarctica]